MKPVGIFLYVGGTIMLLVVLMWGRAGVYSSQMPGFVTLGAAGLAALFLGNRLSKDKDPNRAVAWKPTDALQSAVERSTVPVDANDSGEMMNCPNCGTLTRVGAGFCGNCGANLAATDSVQSSTLAPPPPPPRPVDATPPPPPPPPPPAAQPVSQPEKASNAPEAPPEADAPIEPETPAEPVTPENPAMITLPPGLVGSPPPAASVAPAAPSMAEAVFITSPGMPMAAPPEEDVDATRASTRRRGGSPWRLVLPDGQHYIVEGVVLVGRDAAARAKWPGAKLFSVNDTTKSVSKTHAVIEADSEGLWVRDLKSTNGVVVMGEDGREIDGDDGQRLPVKPGSDIYLGDYIIQVEKD